MHPARPRPSHPPRMHAAHYQLRMGPYLHPYTGPSDHLRSPEFPIGCGKQIRESIADPFSVRHVFLSSDRQKQAFRLLPCYNAALAAGLLGPWLTPPPGLVATAARPSPAVGPALPSASAVAAPVPHTASAVGVASARAVPAAVPAPAAASASAIAAPASVAAAAADAAPSLRRASSGSLGPVWSGVPLPAAAALLSRSSSADAELELRRNPDRAARGPALLGAPDSLLWANVPLHSGAQFYDTRRPVATLLRNAVSQHLQVQPSAIPVERPGLGVFATVDMAEDDAVAYYWGCITKTKIWDVIYNSHVDPFYQPEVSAGENYAAPLLWHSSRAYALGLGVVGHAGGQFSLMGSEQCPAVHMNHAPSTSHACNVKVYEPGNAFDPDHDPSPHTYLTCYATRPILAGEELCLDYSWPRTAWRAVATPYLDEVLSRCRAVLGLPPPFSIGLLRPEVFPSVGSAAAVLAAARASFGQSLGAFGGEDAVPGTRATAAALLQLARALPVTSAVVPQHFQFLSIAGGVRQSDLRASSFLDGEEFASVGLVNALIAHGRAAAALCGVANSGTLRVAAVKLLVAPPVAYGPSPQGEQPVHCDRPEAAGAEGYYSFLLYCTDGAHSSGYPTFDVQAALPAADLPRDDPVACARFAPMFDKARYSRRVVNSGDFLFFDDRMPHFGTRNLLSVPRVTGFVMFGPPLEQDELEPEGDDEYQYYEWDCVFDLYKTEGAEERTPSGPDPYGPKHWEMYARALVYNRAYDPLERFLPVDQRDALWAMRRHHLLRAYFGRSSVPSSRLDSARMYQLSDGTLHRSSRPDP